MEYHAAVVLDGRLFGLTFATSRTIGSGAHIAEQVGERVLIRPLAAYAA